MDNLAQYNAIFRRIDPALLQMRLLSFCLQKKLLAIAKNDTIYIYNTQTKIKLYTIKSYDGEIKQIFFLPDSQYILTSTNHGRVILYNYKDARYNIRIFSSIKKYKTQFPISRYAFAFKEQYLAIGTYDGKIRVINLNSYTTIKEIDATSASIATLCFTDTNKLIIADTDGKIFIHDLQEFKKLQSINTPFSHTKQLLHIPNSNFLLIHSNQEYITLFNLKTNKIIKNKYLKFHTNISYILLSREGNLLVLLQNHEVLHVRLQNESLLHSLLLHNTIQEAYELVAQHPQLLDSKEYKELENIYKKEYLKAISALQHADTKKAQSLLQNYSNILSKKEDIKLLFKAYQHYERFQSLYIQKSYIPLYALSEKFSPLQYSKEYKSIEKEYKEAYKNAQKQILLTNTQKANELLQPYLGVASKRESINLILKNNKDFLLFLDAIKENQYNNIEKILLQYPNFSQLPPYKTFLEQLNRTLNDINTTLNAASIQKAKAMIKNLKGISLISDELNFLEQKAKVITILIQNYKESEFKKCYEIIDEYPQMFIELQLAKMLETHWYKLMQKCENYALYGNIKEIKNTLKELISVKSRTKIIGELLRLTFIITINNFINQKKFSSAENFIYSFIDIFGIDTNLQRVIKEYKKQSSKQLAIIQQDNVGRDEWINNKLIINS